MHLHVHVSYVVNIRGIIFGSCTSIAKELFNSPHEGNVPRFSTCFGGWKVYVCSAVSGMCAKKRRKKSCRSSYLVFSKPAWNLGSLDLAPTRVYSIQPFQHDHW